MAVAPSLIMIQFLSWVADRPRSYPQTMEAWRTTCPRLSVWEDAVIEGLVRLDGKLRLVILTPQGRAVLRRSRSAKADARLPRCVSRFSSGRRRPAAAESRTC